MKKTAWLVVVVLVGALSAYLMSGSAMADKTARGKTVKAPLKASTDIGTEAAIYGPMTVRAVPKAP